jgi:hypothetical protein
MGINIESDSKGKDQLVRVGGRKGRPIRRLPAIKRVSYSTHLPGHREIADSHLPHVSIHVTAKKIEQLLAQLPAFCLPILQMTQNKNDMEHEHLQPAANGIGDAVAAVKCRRPRLRHDGAIERSNAAGLGVRGKSTEYHWVSSRLRPEAPTLALPRKRGRVRVGGLKRAITQRYQ